MSKPARIEFIIKFLIALSGFSDSFVFNNTRYNSFPCGRDRRETSSTSTLFLNKSERMKAQLVFHHDDPPCSVRLIDGRCPECKFVPDMQSLAIHYYCPKCNVKLQRMIYSQCLIKFERP